MSVRVKSVVSCDTLVLKAPTGEETTLHLAFLTTNKLSPRALFESREFLRKLALGKPVKFTVIEEFNGRVNGDISAPIFPSLIEYMLMHGYGKLRDDAATNTGYAHYADTLEKAQEFAESKSLGFYNESVNKPLDVFSEVPPTLYGSGRRVPSIVERVFSGDRVLLRALLSNNEQCLCYANLAGIRSRRSDIGDPIGEAATEFLSTRLLQKNDVRAVFHAPSPFNEERALVTLLHPAGDVAQCLVSAGLCETVNTPQIGSERLLLLKNAQIDAEKKGVGMFRAMALAKEAHRAQFAAKSFEATVIRVISSDSYVLSSGKTVQLSSTRAPRKAEDPEGNYVNAAREFARKLLIGKPVRVQVDGESEFQNESRQLVTLSFGPQFSKNAALEVISAGWATALRHRRDDLARSPFYDELLAAEEKAKEAHSGVFNDKLFKGKNKKTVDASESLVRAKGYLASLGRRSKMPAVVEHVISSGRLRVYVPSENCTLTAVLVGVMVPRNGEPYSEEALAYTFNEWNQRDVQITINGTDKTGAFTSIIYKGNKTLNSELLTHGYASVHVGSANGAGLRDAFMDLQDEAQEKRIGIWKDYEEPDVADPAIQSLSIQPGSLQSQASAQTQTQAPVQAAIALPAIISHASLEDVYLRLMANDGEYKNLNSELSTFFSAASNQSARVFTRKPKKNDQVVVLPDYERAVISAIDRNVNAYEVFCVDTGEKRLASHDDVLPLPQQFQKIKPLATQVRLQFVHKPVNMYAKAYLEYISEFVKTPVRYLAPGILFLNDQDMIENTLNLKLIAGAYASVPEAESGLDTAKPFLAAQKQVKENRVGMWEYGDPREDDDM